MVPGCQRVFPFKAALLSHLNSTVHAPKLYCCPIGIGMTALDTRTAFKPLSALAAHIEAGACAGRKESLRKICGMFEARIDKIAGINVKRLLDGKS